MTRCLQSSHYCLNTVGRVSQAVIALAGRARFCKRLTSAIQRASETAAVLRLTAKSDSADWHSFLVGGCQSVVESVEDGAVIAVLGGVAQGINSLYADLGRGGLGLEDFDGFGEEVFEGHGARVGVLGFAHQLGLDVGRDQLEDLDFCVFELITERLRPGVDRGLGGAVGGRECERDKSQSGGDSDDGRSGAASQAAGAGPR